MTNESREPQAAVPPSGIRELSRTGYERYARAHGGDPEWKGPEAQTKTVPAASGGQGVEPRPDVLVVEDDDDEVRIIRRAIQRSGMESRFLIVRSGEEALEYLRTSATREERKGPPRLKVVILDLKLTGIGGHDVLRAIRADEKLSTLPIVIVSSSRDQRDVFESYRLGANSFVSKNHGLEHPGDHVIAIARYWLELNKPGAPS